MKSIVCQPKNPLVRDLLNPPESRSSGTRDRSLRPTTRVPPRPHHPATPPSKMESRTAASGRRSGQSIVEERRRAALAMYESSEMVLDSEPELFVVPSPVLPIVGSSFRHKDPPKENTPPRVASYRDPPKENSAPTSQHQTTLRPPTTPRTSSNPTSSPSPKKLSVETGNTMKSPRTPSSTIARETSSGSPIRIGEKKGFFRKRFSLGKNSPARGKNSPVTNKSSPVGNPSPSQRRASPLMGSPLGGRRGKKGASTNIGMPFNAKPGSSYQSTPNSAEIVKRKGQEARSIAMTVSTEIEDSPIGPTDSFSSPAFDSRYDVDPAHHASSSAQSSDGSDDISYLTNPSFGDSHGAAPSKKLPKKMEPIDEGVDPFGNYWNDDIGISTRAVNEGLRERSDPFVDPFFVEDEEEIIERYQVYAGDSTSTGSDFRYPPQEQSPRQGSREFNDDAEPDQAAPRFFAESLFQASSDGESRSPSSRNSEDPQVARRFFAESQSQSSLDREARSRASHRSEDPEAIHVTETMSAITQDSDSYARARQLNTMLDPNGDLPPGLPRKKPDLVLDMEELIGIPPPPPPPPRQVAGPTEHEDSFLKGANVDEENSLSRKERDPPAVEGKALTQARMVDMKRKARRTHNEVSPRNKDRLENSQLEASILEAAQRESSRREVSQREARRKAAKKEEADLEAARREAIQREAKRKAAQREAADQQEVARLKAAQVEAARREAAQLEAEKRLAMQRALAQQEMAQKAAAKRNEAAQKAAAQRAAAQQEAAERAAAQKDVARRALEFRKKGKARPKPTPPPPMPDRNVRAPASTLNALSRIAKRGREPSARFDSSKRPIEVQKKESFVPPEPPVVSSRSYFYMKKREVLIEPHVVDIGYHAIRRYRDSQINMGRAEPIYPWRRPKPVREPTSPGDFFAVDEADMDPIQRAGYRLLSKAAVPIQTGVRRYLAQKEAVDRMWALIELQSYARRWRCEAYLYAHTWASVKIQAAFRGWQARDRLDEMHFAAIQIQKVARGFLGALEVFDRYYCVTSIQGIARGWLARKQARQRLGTVIIIQAVCRSYLARVDIEEKHAAATVIQSAYRCYSAQLYYQFDIVDIIIVQSIVRKWKANKISRGLRHEKRIEAAVAIQKYWRGFRAYSDYIFSIADLLVAQRTSRMWLAKREAMRRRRVRSAIVIQAQWRRYKAQMGALYQLVHLIIVQSVIRRRLAIIHVRHLRLKMWAAEMIQSWWRVRCWKKELKCHVAATKIQATWRRFWAYSHYLIMSFEVVRIQSLYRGHLARTESNLQMGCAIIIQSTMRRFLAFKRCQEKKMIQVRVAGASLTIRERCSAKRIQRHWRRSVIVRAERHAAGVIQRFFKMVRDEVDKEARRLTQVQKKKKIGKGKKKRRGKGEDEDKMLERAWLNTMEHDPYGKRSRSKSAQRGKSDETTTVSKPSVKEKPRKQQPANVVDVRPFDEMSDVTAPSVFNRSNIPARVTTLSRKEMSDDLSLEEAWIDTEVRQVKERRMAEQEYLQRHGLQRRVSPYPGRDGPHYLSDSQRAHKSGGRAPSPVMRQPSAVRRHPSPLRHGPSAVHYNNHNAQPQPSRLQDRHSMPYYDGAQGISSPRYQSPIARYPSPSPSAYYDKSRYDDNMNHAGYSQEPKRSHSQQQPYRRYEVPPPPTVHAPRSPAYSDYQQSKDQGGFYRT